MNINIIKHDQAGLCCTSTVFECDYGRFQLFRGIHLSLYKLDDPTEIKVLVYQTTTSPYDLDSHGHIVDSTILATIKRYIVDGL